MGVRTALVYPLRWVPPGRLGVRLPLPAAARNLVVRAGYVALTEYPQTREVAVDGRRMLCDTSDMIQRTMYAFGVWEPAVTAWFREHIRHGDVVIDIGANVGY